MAHHGWVQVKGTPTGNDDATLEPCWLGPYSLEIPGARAIPDQIKLSISGCREEQWTSTDRSRVNVHIDRARKVG
jgi:hypothetical protein